MKTNKNFLFITVILLAAYMLSACGGVPSSSPGAEAAIKVDASLIAYTGTVESMDGDQWVVNGRALTVDPAVINDGPFQVGDTVKVEGSVEQDGSFTVSRIEAPSASDLTDLPQLGDENINANSNDANINDDVANENSNDVNSNDVNINDDNINDDNSNVVDSVNSNDNDSNDDSYEDSNSNDNNTNDDQNDDNSNSSYDNSNDDDNNDDSSSVDNSNSSSDDNYNDSDSSNSNSNDD